MKKKKIIIVITVPLSLETWFKGQARYLSQYYDIEIITSQGNNIDRIRLYENVPITLVDFTRKINPLKDLKIFFQLWRHFCRTRPNMVYSLTPKSGLLGMMGAWFARIPKRVHVVVGLAYLGSEGKRQFLLKTIEKITYFFATHLYSNSLNLTQIIHSELTSKKVSVIGYGSVNGVDTTYFNDTYSDDEKSALRRHLGIPEHSFLLLYTGRIVTDKGINELIKAFEILSLQYSAMDLLLVGDHETELDPVHADTYNMIIKHPSIHSIPFQSDIRPYFCISNILILPSYREGLPNVLIEAGSCGVPLVATNINGCDEVVIEKENGLLISPKNSASIVEAIELLFNDSVLYNKLQSNARNSILTRYDQSFFWDKLHHEFEILLNKSSTPHV